MPLRSVSRSRRTTTVVLASGVIVCAQPSAWRATAASASAWICGIVRGSSRRRAHRGRRARAPQDVAHERLDRRLHRRRALGVEPRVQVDHAVDVFAHRERALHAELLLARLDAVLVESRLGFTHASHEEVERHLRCELHERRLRRVAGSTRPAPTPGRASRRSQMPLRRRSSPSRRAAATCGCRDGRRSPPKAWRCAVGPRR